jgi:LDH2 family malate/lactate/ureidoglycolate dehydrogenase
MPEEASVYVPVGTLTRFMIEALVRMGVPHDDASVVAEILLAADLCGVRSHGIAHLEMYQTAWAWWSGRTR